MMLLKIFNFGDVAVLASEMFNYVILLLLSLGVSFLKNKIYTLLPVILTIILFFINACYNYY